MKYWNSRRIKRIQVRREKREHRAYEEYLKARERARRREEGDPRKNARLMLEALGKPILRRMLARLEKDGAMSVSHLARPFRIMLPAAMRHVAALERCGLIETHKRGRIRFCVVSAKAHKELAAWFSGKHPYDLDQTGA